MTAQAISSRPPIVEVSPDTNIDSILRRRLELEPNATIAQVSREVSLRAIPVKDHDPVLEVFEPKAPKHRGRKLWGGKRGRHRQGAIKPSVWVKVSVAEFNAQVVAVAKGLVALGIQPGQTVGIMSRTRYEWTLLDFAIWAAGAVPVPIYETSSAEQVEWILTDADIHLLIVENAKNAATAATAIAKAGLNTKVLIIEDDVPHPDAEHHGNAIGMLTAGGFQVPDAEIERRRRLAGVDDLATIIYTSGTTGRPKGAELTHGNFTTLSLNTVAEIPQVFNGMGKAILFLPLAHVFARFIEVVAIAGGSVLGHSPDIANLTKDLTSFRPTYLLGVPRVFEKVYNTAEHASAAEKARPYFNWATRVSIAYSRAMDTAAGPSLWLRFQHLFADGLIYSKLRDKLGGRVKYAVSGGSPLGERLGHYYRGLGVNILEGYGLTETTAPTSVNRPTAERVGSVGQMLPGCSVRIAEDGEVQLKGSHIFRGYHNNPEATAEAFTDDGWFRTGDLGRLDEDGFLYITGRKKEIIVTAGGKNVAPAVLEDRIRAHALVSQAVVVGDNRPFIGALITLDQEGLDSWLKMHHKPKMSTLDAMQDPEVRNSIDHAIQRANEAVSQAESIRKWEFIPGDFTVENDYLTPSMKVKRNLVLRDFANHVDDLYIDRREPAPAPQS